MSINDAITKTIQDTLPAATAGELTKYLDEAKKTTETLKAREKGLDKH